MPRVAHTFFYLFFLLKLNAQVTRLPLSFARNSGVADATTAWQGSQSAFSNPAGLRGVTNTTFLASTTWLHGMKELQPLAVAAVFPTNSGVLAFKTQYFRFETYREWGLSLLFAKKMMEKLDAGISLDFAHSAAVGYLSGQNIGFNIGFNYLITKELRAGFWAKNPISFGGAEGTATPSVFRTGFAYFLNKNVTILVDVKKEVRSPVSFLFGFDYKPSEKIAVRGGFSSLPTGFHFGLGYSFSKKIKGDVSVSSHPFLGLTPSFNAEFCPNPETKKKKKEDDY